MIGRTTEPTPPTIMSHQAIHLPEISSGDRLIVLNAFSPMSRAANEPRPATPHSDSENPVASILLSLTCLSRSERESAGISDPYFTWNSREPRINATSPGAGSAPFCGARLSNLAGVGFVRCSFKTRIRLSRVSGATSLWSSAARY